MSMGSLRTHCHTTVESLCILKERTCVPQPVAALPKHSGGSGAVRLVIHDYGWEQEHVAGRVDEGEWNVPRDVKIR